uniref:Uncharacterized protein n=1 Tax=Anopheles atroparvus TaxID=41427 RepID=A0AAG5DTE2_ANOAO
MVSLVNSVRGLACRNTPLLRCMVLRSVSSTATAARRDQCNQKFLTAAAGAPNSALLSPFEPNVWTWQRSFVSKPSVDDIKQRVLKVVGAYDKISSDKVRVSDLIGLVFFFSSSSPTLLCSLAKRSMATRDSPKVQRKGTPYTSADQRTCPAGAQAVRQSKPRKAFFGIALYQRSWTGFTGPRRSDNGNGG